MTDVNEDRLRIMMECFAEEKGITVDQITSKEKKNLRQSVEKLFDLDRAKRDSEASMQRALKAAREFAKPIRERNRFLSLFFS